MALLTVTVNSLGMHFSTFFNLFIHQLNGVIKHILIQLFPISK